MRARRSVTSAPVAPRVFTPILNPPQVCLLGIAGLQKTPRVDSSGELAVGRALGLSLTVDHRVIDGAPANQFLTQLCERPRNALASIPFSALCNAALVLARRHAKVCLKCPRKVAGMVKAPIVGYFG